MTDESDDDDLDRDEPWVRTSLKLRDVDIAEILRLYRVYGKRGYKILETTDLIAARMGCSSETVKRIRRRFISTRVAAREYLGASALRLARRVVRDADVDQSMQILRNPAIGALDPETKGAGTGGNSFVIGVAIESLGAVHVSTVVGPGSPPAPPLEGERIVEMPPDTPAPPAPPALPAGKKRGRPFGAKTDKATPAEWAARRQQEIKTAGG